MSQYINKIRTNEGDLQIDYNALANLPELTSMFSNPNLLINGDFRNPVNQRGITKYEGQTAKSYTIDRWCMGDQDYFRTVELVNGGVTVTNPNETYIGTFQQIFEYTLPQGNYTLSVKVKEIISGGGTMSCGGSHSATKKELSVGINTLTLTDATISSFLIYLAPSSSMTLEWAKLECGTAATPFVPRIYAEEIDLCRRYYNRVSSYRFPMMMTTADVLSGAIPLEKTMRVTPTITIVSFRYFDYSQGAHVEAAEASVDTSYTTSQAVVIQATKNSASTLVKGDVANGTIHVKFDAEIY